MCGSARWDAVVPLPREPLQGLEALKWMRVSAQTVENVLRVRCFTGYVVEGVRYTLDVFNPSNELEMPYRGAGEPVLALLMQSTDSPVIGPRRIRDSLVENSSFYEILKDLDGILHPEAVRGTYSLMSVLCAYLERRADPMYRPWDFLFPIHLLESSMTAPDTKTRFYGEPIGMMKDRYWTLAKVEEWPGRRVLIQVRPGIDQDVAPEYFAVAKALGMVAVQQLVEGNAPQPDEARQ
jgi:hypothetical protein